jgi:NitT/TauT family transport system ATP-binding protein
MSNTPAVPATVERVSATDIGGPAYIEAKGVRKVFASRDKTPVVALDGADLNIGVGEFVSLLGPSGCGKSTLLSMIAGLVPASEGSIRIEGTEVREPYTNIGIVFQNDLLLDWHTVLGNVLVQYVMRGQDPKPHEERARALIASVGLKDFEQKYPWELSGGMRQRVAICRALIHEPPLLLMDEPFGALDALTREQLQVDLQRIWQGTKKTVVFVTHSIDEAIFLSDRVVVMTPRPGRIHDVLRINLQRPRSLAVRDSDVFADNVRHVNHLFQTMGVIHE